MLAVLWCMDFYLLFFHDLPFESMMINGIAIIIVELSNSSQCYLQHFNIATKQNTESPQRLTSIKGMS